LVQRAFSARTYREREAFLYVNGNTDTMQEEKSVDAEDDKSKLLGSNRGQHQEKDDTTSLEGRLYQWKKR